MRYILICVSVLCLALIAFMAPRTFVVKGIVKDAAHHLIAGVTITEKGTKNFTLSGADGRFSITVASATSKLLFSAVGFVLNEVKVSGHTELAVNLTPSNENLDEVVVTGYGTRVRKSVTGSVGLVRSQPNQVYADKAPSPSYFHRPEAEKKFFNGGGRGDTTNFNTEDYDKIIENRFLATNQNPLSTFSIDVDAASYSNIRRFINEGSLPPAGAVRIEEMINYFHYDYPQPKNDDPFSINSELTVCPWNNRHQLLLVGLQGKKIPVENLPASNLVFLIDVSGSMEEENKLPLVKASMKLLVDQLREKDHVSLVVYAGNAGLVLPPTSGAEKEKIKNAIDRLEAGGSTAGGAGIQLAYQTAQQYFQLKGNNRVILCTDGDFNVGESSDASLETLIEKERKTGVFLTVLGYGMRNYKDNKMEKLADKGNGNHAYIDGLSEAKKVLVSEFGGTLFTIAKDVKLQLEFNPQKVQAYRLIGYENRMLSKEDFNNDQKDAGELGSGHTVTALYELIPVGAKNEFEEKVDPLKYQQALALQGAPTDELLTVKFRYKAPDGDVSKLIQHVVAANPVLLERASVNLRFAASVAEAGLLLLHSEFAQSANFDEAIRNARNAMGDDTEGYRKEFVKLMSMARALAVKEEPVDEDAVLNR